MEENEENQEITEQFEEPEIETKAKFTVVGYKYHGRNPNNAIRSLWKRLISRSRVIKYKTNNKETFGVMGTIDPRTGEFDYLVGYQVKKVGKLSKDLDKWEIPKQTYAVVSCTYPQLAEAVDFIYKRWLPESDYQPVDGPEFEFYSEDYDPEDEESHLYLHIPVAEA